MEKDNTFIDSSSFGDEFSRLKPDEQRKMIIDTENNNYEYYLKVKKALKEYQTLDIAPQENCECSRVEISEASSSLSDTYDISYYTELLKGCHQTKEIGHYLPKRKNPDFYLILNLLVSNYLKEIVEIEKFILEETLTSLERQDFLSEISLKKEFIQSLITYRDKKEFTEEEIEEEEKKNTIVYLESSSGNCYALSDIKKIPSEYYSYFLELLLSIQNGTFKNIKTFFRSNVLGGLLEVKNPLARIVFQRIQTNGYIIIAIFMKKYDKALYYREYLDNRVMILKQYDASFDADYLMKQGEITKQLILELGGKS